MSDSQAQAKATGFGFLWNLALFVVTAVYAGVYLRWYATTPLGLSPVLDGNEVLVLAKAIATGELGPDPFFIPPLYPALLSALLQAGLEPELLPSAARGVNLACHLLSTLCVAYLARRVWRSQRCAASGGLLWGLNPVALHFAGDPLPVNLAISLILLGACAAAQLARGKSVGLGAAFVCAAAWTLAALTVTEAMVLIALAPILTVILARGGGNKLATTFLAVLISGGILIAFGYGNYKISGQFQITPLQNSYDFWAANRPGSHGRFPQRFVSMRSFNETAPSGRIESERQYAEENPQDPTTDYKIINRYWNGKAWSYVRDSTTGFANHLSNKFLYLANNFEQYDNKTYSLHKQRSPWLAFNPIGWGLLLLLAGAGVCLAWKRRLTRVLVAMVAVYAMAVLAFYVSARARVPMAPLLAALAGWVGRPVMHVKLGKRRGVIAAGVAALALALITFIPLPEKERQETLIYDHMVLARAATRLDDYLLAVRHAEAAAKALPHSPLALETLCLTRYRYWRAILPQRPSRDSMEKTLSACQHAARLQESQHALVIHAHILWNLGQTQAARTIWYQLVDASSEHTETALQALIVTRQLRGSDRSWLDSTPRDSLSIALLAALALDEDPTVRKILNTRIGKDEANKLIADLRAQFLTSKPSANNN